MSSKSRDRRSVKAESTPPVSSSSDEDSSSDSSGSESGGEHEESCHRCRRKGKLLCCDTCPLVFHLSCLTPPLTEIPKGRWTCPVCDGTMPRQEKRTPRRRLSRSSSASAPTTRRPRRSSTAPSASELEEAANTPSSARRGQKRSLPPSKGNATKRPRRESAKASASDDDTRRPRKSTKVKKEDQTGAESDDQVALEHSGEDSEPEEVGPPDYSAEGDSDSDEEMEENMEEDEEMQRKVSAKLRGVSNFGDGFLDLPVFYTPGMITRRYKNKTVDKILSWAATEPLPDDASEEDQELAEASRLYLVKLEDICYRKCFWTPRLVLTFIAMPKLRSFERAQPPFYENIKNKKEIYSPSYYDIHRIIAYKPKNTMYLVKWKGLPYEDSTWERKIDLDPEFVQEFQQREDYFACQKRMEEIETRSRKRFSNLREQPKCVEGGVLKDYQLQGVSWILSAWQKNVNVILADEMGLGKTVQTIAFLSMLHHFKTRGPFLVVVPVSTLRNWEREFAKWAPHIYLLKYTGTQEARRLMREHEFFFKEKEQKESSKNRLLKFEVLLTSYNMILQDESVLKRYSWKALVVDEAQRLKNKSSKLFQNLVDFKFDFKLLLTGTPLQNTLQELFVLLHFLDPSEFASESDFMAQFGDVVTGEQHIQKLHKLLAPHMLRRVKADVLDNLPGKEEVIIRVEMTELQLKWYKAILTRNYQVLSGMTPYGKTTKLNLTNVIMELQKCCNHPFLFPGVEPEEESRSTEQVLETLITASGKLLLLDKMLDKLKAQGHRVLIFSQMTRMLDILEDYLTYKNYGYERIDGSVTGADRQERIDRFNAKDSTRFCFLLSTRAGGLGINLATADTVVIYDSDWNPHNDIQALSRAHRIGQENDVMIYRMVTRNSVEQSILQRAKQKMMIEYLVVEKMGAKGETKLKKGELDDIIRFGSKELFEEDSNVGSGGIAYDDEAVDRLLDRSGFAQAKEKGVGLGESADKYLNSFRVADYDIVEEEEPLTNRDEMRKDAYWETLLSDRHQQMLKQDAIEAAETLGKGKRQRQQSQFYGAETRKSDSDEEENGDTPRRTLERRNSARSLSDKAGAADAMDEEDDDSTSLAKGKGRLLKIKGFSPNQRAAFLKMVMSYGLQDEFWRSLHNKGQGFLRAKSALQLHEYTRVLLNHLLEKENNQPCHNDGCPKDSSLFPKEVLSRIFSIYLINRKIEQTTSAAEFDIRENSWTELPQSWDDPSGWNKEHDYLFLKGVARHGHGKWNEIMQDQSLDLYRAALKITGRKMPTPSGGGMPQIGGQPKPASVVYRPDKIVSRFLRKRLVLLENALFVEFQLYDKGELFDMGDTSQLTLLLDNQPANASGEDEVMEDAEAEAAAPSKASGTNGAVVTPQNEVLIQQYAEHIKQTKHVQISEMMATTLSLPPEKSEEEQDTQTDFLLRMDFIGAFGDLYNQAHHLKSQLDSYLAELKHTEALREAESDYINGLRVLDDEAAQAKSHLSKLGDRL